MAGRRPRCWDKGPGWPGRDPHVGTRDLSGQKVTQVVHRGLRCWDKGP